MFFCYSLSSSPSGTGSFDLIVTKELPDNAAAAPLFPVGPERRGKKEGEREEGSSFSVSVEPKRYEKRERGKSSPALHPCFLCRRARGTNRSQQEEKKALKTKREAGGEAKRVVRELHLLTSRCSPPCL